VGAAYSQTALVEYCVSCKSKLLNSGRVGQTRVVKCARCKLCTAYLVHPDQP
jgi:hypothetical protein